MCNLSAANAVMVKAAMTEVDGLVHQTAMAKDNLVTSKQLFGDDHPATRMAARLYLEAVQLTTERYRSMATHTKTYMDAVLA